MKTAREKLGVAAPTWSSAACLSSSPPPLMGEENVMPLSGGQVGCPSRVRGRLSACPGPAQSFPQLVCLGGTARLGSKRGQWRAPAVQQLLSAKCTVGRT